MKILIVAHLDDEMLWFNPDNFDKIIIVFCDRLGHASDYEFNNNRTRALANHPLFYSIECLNYIESGIADKNSILDIGLKKKIFLENWHKLELELPELIKGADEIYTHNQWGEFGHPEHVMINAVVNTVAGDIPIYCRENMVGPANNFSMPREEFSDIDRFYELRNLYLEYHIWTFRLDYRPPQVLKYFKEEDFKNRKTKIII